MDSRLVTAVEDVTNARFNELRPGCAKAVLQQNSLAQTGVFRVQPGCGVPAHTHSQVHDLFVGVKGSVEIRYEGEHGPRVLALRPGGFCSVPSGVRHEVANPSKTDEAFFLLVHTPHVHFDYIPVPRA